MNVKTTRQESQPCPSCGTQFDAATDPFGKSKPTRGSWSVCSACGSFLRYTRGKRWRLARLVEVGALPDDHRIMLQAMRRAIEETRRERNRDGVIFSVGSGRIIFK